MSFFVLASFLPIGATAGIDNLNLVTKSQIIEQIKDHYANSNSLKQYRVKFKRIGLFGPQSYDFKHPTSSYRQQNTQIDLSKRHFFTQTKRGGFPGGFLFETNEFQNDAQSIRYDVNGVLYGKRAFDRDMQAFDRELEEVDIIIDFFAIKQLLQAKESDLSLSLSQDKSMFTIGYQVNNEEDKHIIELEFLANPLTLRSLTQISSDEHSPKTRYSYDNFVKMNGFALASEVSVTRGETSNQYLISEFEKIQGINAEDLSLPIGYGPLVKPTQKELTIEEIAKGLHLISNVSSDRHVLIQQTKTELTVFGAPSSNKVSEEVIQLIESNFPEHPIKNVYITHPHSDHIGGLGAYAKRGVVVLADAHSIDAIRHFSPFSESINSFKFREITHHEIIDGVQYHIPKNSHAKGQSFAYFMNEKIIYEGDFLEIPFDNSIATYMSDVEKEFVEYLRDENLKIERIVGHHRNGNISPKVMNDYYHANTHPRNKVGTKE